MRYSLKYKLLATTMAAALGGCGLRIPEIQEPWEGPHATSKMVWAIVRKVQCELQDAVQYIHDSSLGDASHPQKWFDNWGVQVALTLTIDEKSALNPGVTFNTPMIPGTTHFPGNITVPGSQSYALGLGGSFSSDANRIDAVTFYYTVKDLLKVKDCPADGAVVDAAGSLLLDQSDLEIKDWLVPTVQLQGITGGVTYPDSATGPNKQDSITHHIKFIVSTSGNITPMWKLIRVSANAAGNFFSSQRDRTHELLFTFGPLDKATGQPTTSAANTHLASQIGIAVSNNIRIYFGQ